MSTLAVTSACQSTRILRWAILTGHTMRGILRNVPTQLSQPNTEPPTGLWGEETSELGLMKRGVSIYSYKLPCEHCFCSVP